MSVDAASRRWGARLAGPAGDLEELAEHLQGRTALRRGDEGWELTDEEWEGMQDAGDVHERAVIIGPRLSAMARLCIGASEAIQYNDAVLERTANGSVKHAFGRATVSGGGRVRVSAVIVGEDGVVRPTSPPASWQEYLDLAASDPDVERAFAFFAAPVSWVTIFAALDAVGGDRRIQVEGKKGYEAIAARGWAARDELGRFRGTAQSYAAVGVAARHGRNVPSPTNPMPLSDGCVLVAQVITKWMQWIQAGRP